MKVSLDFEGVLAQAWSDDELAGLDRDTLLLSALSVTGARRRFGARSIVSFLGAFASIEIITARPGRDAPAIAAWLGEHLPGLEGAAIHSCPPDRRAAFVRSAGIALHIDHDPRADDGAAGRCVIWKDQPVEHLLRELAAVLARCGGLRLGGRRVTRIEELPSFSSTPVYRVETTGGVFKLRVVENAGRSAMLALIHRLAADHAPVADLLPPQLPGLPAFVHVIPYLPGQTPYLCPPPDGVALVERVARWQAALHERTVRDDGTCLVSCACDAFNLCVSEDGAAGIIDAADCLHAPRWVDLIWTERLLFPWTGGADRFFATYFSATTARPTHDDVTEALAGYYYWHHEIIRRSVRRRAADPEVLALLRQVKASKAPPPTRTLLTGYAV